MRGLEALIAHQAEISAGEVHLVEVDDRGFALAHTDAERAAGTNTEACPVHRWLAELEEAPVKAGRYIVMRRPPCGYSDDHGAEPYELRPLAGTFR